MKIVKNSFFILLFIVVFSNRSFCQQEFAQSRAMNLFNQGKYDSVLMEVPQWIQKNRISSDRQGIALYFLAESNYNLGLAEMSKNRAISFFRDAYRNFDKCIESTDIKVRFRDLYHAAKYKKGWCKFRLAELGDSNIPTILRQAYNDFLSVESQAPDSLKVYSNFMAGEVQMLRVTNQRYQIFSRSYTASDINQILALLNDARSKYDFVLSNSFSRESLKLICRIRLMDIYFAFGKIYQGVNETVFPGIKDPLKQNTLPKTIKYYFEKTVYTSVLKNLPIDQIRRMQPVIDYSQALTYLNMYLALNDGESSLRFTEIIDKLNVPYLNSEKNFRKGNKDQANRDLKSVSFRNLGLKNSYYLRSSGEIPESYYWLGFVQYILNLHDAAGNFDKFIHSFGSQHPAQIRMQLLYEDAQLRKYSLQFESMLENINNNVANLQNLAPQVENFQPQTGRIQNEKDLLLTRVQIAIEVGKGGNNVASRIYQNVFNGDLESALEQIRYLLPLAASVTGARRASYLEALAFLLQITENQRSAETRFYRGVSISLDAEIGKTSSNKIELFREAADTLANVSGDYAIEAKYIRARSLFFAGEYNNAQQLLTELIRDKGSLRALFYLGELFRQTGRGAAARQCYDRVMELTEHREGGEFWFRNAQSAKANSGVGGNKELSPSDLSGVKFPDVLLTVNGRPLTYEGLANYKYLQASYAEQSVTLLKMFGLPKRTIYPSVHRLKNSQIISAGIFPDFSSPINEMKGAIASGLQLIVLNPEGVKSEKNQVKLERKKLAGNKNGVYSKKPIPLNSVQTIEVLNPYCYPFIEKHQFKKPVADSVFVILFPRIKYEKEKKENNPAVSVIFYPKRPDKNIILHPGNKNPDKNSELFNDLSGNIYLRDFVFHPQLQKYLVVYSEENRILKYSVEGKDEGEFVLELSKCGQLDSPEGIALDSDGTIYISDWGNHRILLFNRNGKFIKSIGEYGTNSKIGKLVKFIFPTRLCISEDTKGITYNGKIIYADKILFVADRNGVHMLNSRGYFYETVIKPSKQFPLNSFYGVASVGFGPGTELFVVDRNKSEVISHICLRKNE